MSIKLRVKEKKTVEEGVYLAKLVSIDEAEGKYGPYLKFKFLILEEGEYEGMSITGLVGKDLQVGNKLYKWLTALNGRGFDVDETVVVEEQVGKKCRIVVSNKTDDDGNITYKIDNVLSLKKTKVKEDEESEDIENDEENLFKTKNAKDIDEEDENPKKENDENIDEDEDEKFKKKDVEFEDEEDEF